MGAAACDYVAQPIEHIRKRTLTPIHSAQPCQVGCDRPPFLTRNTGVIAITNNAQLILSERISTRYRSLRASECTLQVWESLF